MNKLICDITIRNVFLSVTVSLIQTLTGFAQVPNGYNWWNPANNSFPVVEGRAWPGETENYSRFPSRAAGTVNPNVWNISHASAGLYLKFKTNAGKIVVRYVVRDKGSFAMSHMPATGVSGVDLYALDHNGEWLWAPGRFSFADTIEYRFSGIAVDDGFSGRDCEFRLFLPLYNAVQWMEIGVPAGSSFVPMPLNAEKPVVVYGTSITQGACATRPGLAWTAILQRELDRPLVNLGFTGSGRLEKPVIDLMAEIDAKLYILDCLPNLTAGAGFTCEEVERRIRESVTLLKKAHPSTPVLLVEHSGGYTFRVIDTVKNREYENVNNILRNVFLQLKREGVRDLHLLGNKAIDLGIDATVDGLHPNDIGMMNYANAYEKEIRTILNEPVGRLTTTIPTVQSRDGYYDWRSRHAGILQENKSHPPASVILANSIIHYWGGDPGTSLSRGSNSWNKYLQPLGLRNLGFGWDRIENVLWRVYHEELDGFDAKQIVLMIGTNNLTVNNDEEIIAGLKNLVEQIRIRQPGATILLSGILPRRHMEQRIVSLNKGIARLSALLKVQFIDPGSVLLNYNRKIDDSLFEDGLHPNAAGYQKLGAQLANALLLDVFQ